MSRICGKCGSGNIVPDRFSDTGERCMMCGQQNGFIERERERVMPEQGQLNLDGPQLTVEQRAVWDCIRDRRGKGNEILGTEISRMTGIEYTTVRAMIAHLITKHGKLIGSNGNGYFIPVTPAEIAAVTKSLRHRGIMILVRAAQLQKTSLVAIFNQTLLEYEYEKEETTNA